MTLAQPSAPRFDLDLKPTSGLYLAVGLEAGAVIALQICIMRIFSVGSWAHFGSLVVSLAMLGFGLTSAVMCIGKGWFDRHWRGVATVAGAVRSADGRRRTSGAADPVQRHLPDLRSGAEVAAVRQLPALHAAVPRRRVLPRHRIPQGQQDFRPRLFRRSHRRRPVRAAFLVAMYLFDAREPHRGAADPVVPRQHAVVLGARQSSRRARLVVVAARRSPALRAAGALGIPKLAVSDYKGVAYARKFPDSERVYERASPFGYLEVYSSSYLHFAPGLSDNAAFNLPEIPANAYLGMYIDSEGPSGIIRNLPAEDRLFPLPADALSLPDQADARHVRRAVRRRHLDRGRAAQLQDRDRGGGQSRGARRLPQRQGLRDFTGDILNDPKVHVIDYDGRLYLANTDKRYDVIDLSLADSAGLSNPGGFAIVEKYAYTREAMPATCARSRTAACFR